MFDLEQAQRRLEAVDRARQLLAEASEAIAEADVKNVRVAKAMAMCRKELTDFHHVVEYSIRKREDRIADDQSARQKRQKEAEEQEQGSGLAGQPSEEGCLSPGVRGQPEEAEQRQQEGGSNPSQQRDGSHRLHSWY